MMGLEDGGQIDENLSVLRVYRDLGAGYLTLTHAKTIPGIGGLTPFGETVVHELNRIGVVMATYAVSYLSEPVFGAARPRTRLACSTRRRSRSAYLRTVPVSTTWARDRPFLTRGIAIV